MSSRSRLQTLTQPNARPRNFRNPFGLAHYDRELAGVKNRKALVHALDEYYG